jgi:hypothetical protein
MRCCWRIASAFPGKFGPAVAAYWQRLQARQGFRRAVAAEKLAGEQQKVAPRS